MYRLFLNVWQCQAQALIVLLKILDLISLAILFLNGKPGSGVGR